MAEATSDPIHMLFGRGAGTTSILPGLKGEDAPTFESSLIKLMVELGIVGLLSWTLVLGQVVLLLFAANSAASARRMTASRRSHVALIAFTAMAILVLQEHLVHDMLVTWVFAAYFWTILGTIIALSREQLRAAAPLTNVREGGYGRVGKRVALAP